ncbi:RNA 2',3'-cyclic phosphodiesterase [Paenibacillus marinisediminis]
MSDWRVFIALPLPDEAKEWIRHQVEEHLPYADRAFKRLSDHRDYHITVQFLGDVKQEQLNAAVKDQTAFSLRLGTWDIFGRSLSPRVLWMGVEGELARLHEMQRYVLKQMSTIGFIPEDRPYHPHITTARQYTGSAAFDLQAVRQALTEAPPSWSADQIVLYRTRLGERPMYEVIGKVMFQ